MDVVTISELTKQWHISARMIAYYCEQGRIIGAVKKGKTWLIPADAKKPVRHRSHVYNDADVTLSKVQEAEPDHHYLPNEIFHYLNMTRETLRYYEELGLINPKRNDENHYREFGLYDISQLLTIDFYKKRGFTANDMKQYLQTESLHTYIEAMTVQERCLMKEISRLQAMHQRLSETKAYCETYANHNEAYILKELPLYEVLETFDDLQTFIEHHSHNRMLDLDQEDCLSNVIRILSFDQDGYKGSGMCLIKKVNHREPQKKEAQYLKQETSLYITMDALSNDDTVMENMFKECHQWAEQNHVALAGIVYIFLRFMTLKEHEKRHYYEIWVPIKSSNHY